MIAKGANVDKLSEAYFRNLKTQFGDSLELGDEFRWEWVSIPHIYQVPFYVGPPTNPRITGAKLR